VSGEHIYTSHEDKSATIDEFYENLLGKCDDREYTINLSELEIISHDLLISSSHLVRKKCGIQLKSYLQTKLLGQMALHDVSIKLVGPS
jgi:hypothetical protein